MALIKGITVKLIERTVSGTDEFNKRTFTEEEHDIGNVLVGEPSAEEIANELNMSGRKLAYTLAIPKGDTHSWCNAGVVLPEPFAGSYRVIGEPTAGIEANIPLDWNRKVKVERYEQ